MSIIPGWPVKPIGERARALRYDGGNEWTAVDYTDLHPGDIIKPVSAEGEDINPFTFEPLTDNVCVVTSEPQPACGIGIGYEIGVDVVGTLNEALARATNR